MKKIRLIIREACTRHFDIHDDISCDKISEKEGLQKMGESLDQAETQIKALVNIGEINKVMVNWMREAGKKSYPSLNPRIRIRLARAIKQWIEKL